MSGIRTRRAVARRRKAIALAAAGAVVLTGATVTSLAAWLDEEWVTAGVDGLAGAASSEFEIEQSVATDAGAWTDRETGPGGVIDFDDVVQSLSPGAVAYGWVSLRAADGSIGGDLVLASDYTDGDGDLGDALTYGATVHADPSTCTSASYASGVELVAVDTELETGSGATDFPLDAGSGAAGTPRTVCFRIEFPSDRADDALQGLTADVGWYFIATSD